MRAGGRGLGGRAASALAVLFLSGCAGTSHVITGTARPPSSPAMVTVYSTAPPVFEEIAFVRAHRKTLFNASGSRNTDVIVERLKFEAAKLGANGLLIDRLDQSEAISLGGGAGTESYSAHGIISLSLGMSVGIFDAAGKGRAIYVPPDPTH